jgi:two-component system, NarL family, sensor histidine kinase BarA
MTAEIDRETWDGLVAMTGDDLAFVDDLVDTYLVEGRGQVGELRAAAAAHDVAAAVRPAHSLKSGSLNVGALALGEACRALESAARDGAVPDLAAQVDAIAVAFDGVETALLEERAARPA